MQRSQIRTAPFRRHHRYQRTAAVVAIMVIALVHPSAARAQSGDDSQPAAKPSTTTSVPVQAVPAQGDRTTDGSTLVVVPKDCVPPPTTTPPNTTTSTTSTTPPASTDSTVVTTPPTTVPDPCAPIEISDDGGGDADQDAVDEAEPVPGYTGGGPVISANPISEVAPGIWQLPIVVVGAQARQAAAKAVAAAEAQAREYERAAEAAEQVVMRERENLSRLDVQIASARDAQRAAEGAQAQVQTTVDRSAVDLYIGSPDTSTALPSAIGGNDELDWKAQQVSSNAAIEWVVGLLTDAKHQHQTMTRDADVLAATRPELTSRLQRAASEATVATTAAEAARTELEVLRGRADDPSVTAGGLVALRPLTAGSTVTFPIAGNWNFIDSWGFPRSGGRWHQGADIFSPRNTPIVAVEDGIVLPTSNRLGGLVVYLDGVSRNRYYYAHLETLAPGVVPGASVKAGQIIGFVGTSGNAAGTPAHLHFEVKPGGGEPINPYPLLKTLSEAVNTARRAGASPSVPDDVLATLDAPALAALIRGGTVVPPSVIVLLPGQVAETLVAEGLVDRPATLPDPTGDPTDAGAELTEPLGQS